MFEQRARVWPLIIVLLGTLGSLLLSAGASAHEVAQESTTEIRGTLRTIDGDGVDVFVEGVDVLVADEDGNPIGTATSDENGEWAVPVPGAGTYQVQGKRYID